MTTTKFSKASCFAFVRGYAHACQDAYMTPRPDPKAAGRFQASQHVVAKVRNMRANKEFTKDDFVLYLRERLAANAGVHEALSEFKSVGSHAGNDDSYYEGYSEVIFDILTHVLNNDFQGGGK